jgi:fructose-1,6-bisphosphatase/inositol monophosphatase family enzyme
VSDLLAPGLSRGTVSTFARWLFAATGQAISAPFHDPTLTVDTKDDDSPVPRADREVERAPRERSARSFPDPGIVGEEDGAKRRDGDLAWLLDAIDRTRSCVAGCPLFGTLVGLPHEGGPVFAGLHAP